MEKLKVARIRENWTQAQLASACGVTTITISNIERGVTKPQNSTKEKIETILGQINWHATENDGLIHSNGAFYQNSNGTRIKTEDL